MPGKIVERMDVKQLFECESRTTQEILFNNAASGAVGIDTRDFDGAVFIVDAGVFTGTVDFAVFENATNDAATSTAIVGADFTQITSANDKAVQYGHVKSSEHKRFLFLRSNKTVDANAALFSASIVLGRADKNPPSTAEVFKV